MIVCMVYVFRLYGFEGVALLGVWYVGFVWADRANCHVEIHMIPTCLENVWFVFTIPTNPFNICLLLT